MRTRTWVLRNHPFIMYCFVLIFSVFPFTNTCDFSASAGNKRLSEMSFRELFLRIIYSLVQVGLFDLFHWRSTFLQDVNVALLCKPCTIYIYSYDRRQDAVRLSVTRCHWVKTTQTRITKSPPTDSPRTLVFGIKNSSRNSKGFTPSEGVKLG